VRTECYRSVNTDFWEKDTHTSLLQWYGSGMSILSLSRSLFRKAAIDIGVPKDRVAYVISWDRCTAISASPKRRARASPNKLSGVLVEMKGCWYLIEAFQEIVRRVPDAELFHLFWVIGDGTVRASLEALAKK